SDEPGGSPARRPHAWRTQRGEPVGQEGRREDAQQEEVVAAADRPWPQARQSDAILRARDNYGSFSQEGTVRAGRAAEARARNEFAQREEGHQDLVARE